MKTKKCFKCKRTLSVECFKKHKNRKDGLQADCIECQAEYRKKHYQNNKEKYKTRALARNNKVRQELQDRVNNYKAKRGCNRCAENHVACLQFHHIYPSNKTMCISQMITQRLNWDVILSEIKKCEVLCANCHFKEHWRES